MNNQRCGTCIHYRTIDETVGQCYLLAVKIESGVAIVDRRETLQTIKMSRKEKNYNEVVVQATFGCTGHSIRKTLESQNTLDK